MAKPGFWNDNEGRDYPFLLDQTGRSDSDNGTIGRLPLSTVVDLGVLMGDESGYDPLTHKVWLARVERTGANTLELELRTDAPAALSMPLVFTRSLSEEPQYELVEAAVETEESASPCDTAPVWEAYLVTGDLRAIFDLLPVVGNELTGTSDNVTPEPAVIQNFSKHRIRGIGLANLDRTRAENPEYCQPLCWDTEPGLTQVRARCLTGPILFKEGYNSAIAQDDGRNRLVFSAAVGQGEGEPCGDFEYFPGETPPEGRETLDGALHCGQVVRSLGGAIGRSVDIVPAGGTSISYDQSRSKIIVTVDLRNMVLAGLFDANEGCDEPDIEEEVGPCDCASA